jgi:NADH-quinone oxidoreductase subunit L
VGSVLAGYLGVPAVLGGSNRIEHFLEPSFTAPGIESGEAGESHAGAGRPGSSDPGAQVAGDHAEDHGTELALMGLSSGAAVGGIAIAWFFFLRRKEASEALARSFAGVHRTLLNKYYVDEIYDAAVVQPIHRLSERSLWKFFDAGVIDGAVNGAGRIVSGASGVLKHVQTGSIRAYAMGVLVGVVVILGYYVWR